MDNRTHDHYDGEDDAPTGKQELWGWFSYGLAAEVFAVCGVGSFLPVTLEQLARESGVLLPDKTTSCIKPAADVGTAGEVARLFRRQQCVVTLLGHEVNTSSFALYSSSAAVFVQTLLLISIGAFADHGNFRKRLLLTFAYTGAVSCMLFLAVGPSVYLLAIPLTVVSIASLGCSFVLLNSFLPLLVAKHPAGKAAYDSIPLRATNIPADADDDSGDESDVLQDPLDDWTADGLLSGRPNAQRTHGDDQTASDLKLSNQISSKGIGIGYASAVFVQILSIGIILLYRKLQSPESTSSATLPMRTVLFVVGLWWATFTIPTALWLRPRPGPPLPTQAAGPSRNRLIVGLHYIIFAWASLWRTIKIATRLRQVVVYLLGWFLLSDAVATISGTAILFARTELKMGTAETAILSISVTLAGIGGAFCWPIIGDRFQLPSMSIIIACICLMIFIPVYGLLGFLPIFQKLGFIGLQQVWEIYPLALLLGFCFGGLGSYSRSTYLFLIPPGREAAFYALFAVTDKSSSLIGPTIVAAIIDATGSIRTAFWFLLVLMISPIPFFWFVDIDRGRRDALAMVEDKRRWVDA